MVDLFSAIEELEVIIKHLPGRHDQAAHAGSKGGGDIPTSANYKKAAVVAKQASANVWKASGKTKAQKRVKAKLARTAAKAHNKAGRLASDKGDRRFHYDEAAMFENAADRLIAD